MGMREFVNQRPWMGWAIAGVVILFAAWLAIYRLGAGADSYDEKRMQEWVIVKYTDTGKEERIPRGRLIKMLADQGGPIDPTKGIINPETKQPTGFIYNKDEWESLVKQLNEDRAAAEKGKPKLPPPPKGK